MFDENRRTFYEDMRINESEMRLSRLNRRVMLLEMRRFELSMRINISEMRTMVFKS